MKIHIIGASGSGKSYFARTLSEKIHIPSYSLDDLFWDNSGSSYSVKRDAAVRDAMLEKILKKDSWIIEGVQYAWLEKSFEQADRIYLMETPPWLCRIRIVRRFLERKLNRTNRNNETLRSLLDLLKWTHKFYTVNFPEIRHQLEAYNNKVIHVASKKDAASILNACKF